MIRYLLFTFLFIIPEECDYSSKEQEIAPIQTTSTELIEEDFFLNVTQYFTDRLGLKGTDNSPAVHEGIDFINENRRIDDVPVYSVLTWERLFTLERDVLKSIHLLEIICCVSVAVVGATML